MKSGIKIIVLLGALLFPTSGIAETISIHGSTTFVAAVFDAHAAEIQRDSGLVLDIVANGSGKGLLDLAKGKADIAMISSDLAATAAKVNAETPGAIDIAAFKPLEILKTYVAFTVNPSNPVKELKESQIADILSGKTTNWKEVGGEDRPILVVTEIPSGGLRSDVEKNLLGGKPIKADRREMLNATMIERIVAQIPEALGIMSESSTTPSVRPLVLDKKEKISLYYVTKGDPLPAAKRLIAATLKQVGK